MKFFKGKASKEQSRHHRQKECLCHHEYNHCIANNEYGFILEIKPTMDIAALNISEFFTRSTKSHNITTTAATTTQSAELKKALGFEVCYLSFLRNLKDRNPFLL